jgi:hypothetical protein
VATDLGAVAEGLFAAVMAPLVLGGELRPGHAIGSRSALALGPSRTVADTELAERVQRARVRRARRLAPVDALPDASAEDWALSAVVNDVLQAANPTFDALLRRSSAVRILELAAATVDRVAAPRTAGEALSRHTWLGRLLDVARTDTTVSWWVGSRSFLGVDPPARLQAWPDLRRVSVVRTPRRLLELTPLPVDRARLTQVVGALLARTPLTDLATCARAAPPFAWNETTLALVAGRSGRTLVERAIAALPAAEVDAALGRATRELLSRKPRASWAPAVTLLAERAIAQAQGHVAAAPSDAPSQPPREEAVFARALGAAAACGLLASGGGPWPEAERRRLAGTLGAAAASPAGREALGLLAAEAAADAPVRS